MPNRLAICLPTHQTVDAGTAVDLMTMSLYLGNRAWALGLEAISVHQKGSTYLPVSREEIATQALGRGATHLLWVDGDMRFPVYAAERLLAHDLDFVAANYRRRGPEGGSTAVSLTTGEPIAALGEGLERVGMVGFGMCLVKASVFSRVPTPWFDSGYRAGLFLGEDFVFCKKAVGEGIDLWVDHGLSREIGHMWEREMRLRVQYTDGATESTDLVTYPPLGLLTETEHDE